MTEISRVSLFGKLNSVGYKAIESATVFCKMRGNPYVELVHWLHQILQLQDSDLHRIIKQFNLLLDYHRIGRIVKAFIGLRVNANKLMNVVGPLQDNPDVQVLYRTTGNVDLFVEVIFKDMEELKQFLEQELNIDGISYTEVTVVIGPYKRCPCTGL